MDRTLPLTLSLFHSVLKVLISINPNRVILEPLVVRATGR